MEVKYIGNPTDEHALIPGNSYSLNVLNMSGKLYDPVNNEYVNDTRVMVWVSKKHTEALFYKVYSSEEEIKNDFEIL